MVWGLAPAKVFGGGAVASAWAAGQLTAGDAAGITCAIVAVITLVLAVRASAAKKLAAAIAAAEQRGRDARDAEVTAARAEATRMEDQRDQARRERREVEDQMEFFRNQYAALLQRGAGAPQVQLPPLPVHEDQDDRA